MAALLPELLVTLAAAGAAAPTLPPLIEAFCHEITSYGSRQGFGSPGSASVEVLACYLDSLYECVKTAHENVLPLATPQAQLVLSALWEQLRLSELRRRDPAVDTTGDEDDIFDSVVEGTWHLVRTVPAEEAHVTHAGFLDGVPRLLQAGTPTDAVLKAVAGLLGAHDEEGGGTPAVRVSEETRARALHTLAWMQAQVPGELWAAAWAELAEEEQAVLG